MPALTIAIDQRGPEDLQGPGQPQQAEHADGGERNPMDAEIHR